MRMFVIWAVLTTSIFISQMVDCGANSIKIPVDSQSFEYWSSNLNRLVPMNIQEKLTYGTLGLHQLQLLNATSIFHLASTKIASRPEIFDIIIRYHSNVLIAARIASVIRDLETARQFLNRLHSHTIGDYSKGAPVVNKAPGREVTEPLPEAVMRVIIDHLLANERSSADQMTEVAAESAPNILVHASLRRIGTIDSYTMLHGKVLENFRFKVDWRHVSENRRRMWFMYIDRHNADIFSAKEMAELPTPSLLLPILVGANLTTVAKLGRFAPQILATSNDWQSIIGQDDMFTPAQLQVMADHVEWSNQRRSKRLRRGIVKYLFFEQLDGNLDAAEDDALPSDLPYTNRLRTLNLIAERLAKSTESLSLGEDVLVHSAGGSGPIFHILDKHHFASTGRPPVTDVAMVEKFTSKLLTSARDWMESLYATLDSVSIYMRRSQASILVNKLMEVQSAYISVLSNLATDTNASSEVKLLVKTRSKEPLFVPAWLVPALSYLIILDIDSAKSHILVNNGKHAQPGPIWTHLIDSMAKLSVAQQWSTFVAIMNFTDGKRRKESLPSIAPQLLTSSPDLATKFISPSEFGLMLREKQFSEAVMQKDGIGLLRLPLAHRKALLANELRFKTEEVMFFLYDEKAADAILSAMSCYDVNQFDDVDIPLLIARYVDMLNRFGREAPTNMERPIKTFPLSLRMCMARKMHRLLRYQWNLLGLRQMNVKIRNDSYTHPYDENGAIVEILKHRLHSDWIDGLTGHFWSRYRSELHLAAIHEHHDELLSIIESIGRLPMLHLMAYMPWPEFHRMAELAYGQLSRRTDLRLVHLSTMGTLTFGSVDVLTHVYIDDFKAFIETHLQGREGVASQMLCLPESYRQTVASLLVKAYGQPESWSAETVFKLGDLMINLDDETWYRIPTQSILRVLPHLLDRSNLVRQYDSVLTVAWSRQAIHVCTKWLGNSDDAHYLESHFKSYARFLLAASQLSVDLVNSMSASDSNVEHTRPKRVILHEASMFRVKRDSAAHDSTDGANYARSVIMSRVNAFLTSANDDAQSVATIEKIEELYDRLQESTATKMKEVLDITVDPEDVAEVISAKMGEMNQKQVNDESVIEMANYLSVGYNKLAEFAVELLNWYPEDVGLDEEEFCAVLNRLCQDRQSKTASRRSDDIMPHYVHPTNSIINWAGQKIDSQTKLTCEGLLAASWTTVSVVGTDFDLWSDGEVQSCMDVLGHNRWFERTTKLDIWSRIKRSKIFSNDKLYPTTANMLDNLLEAVILTGDAGRLQLHPKQMETISVVGQFSHFNMTILARLAAQIEVGAGSKLPLAELSRNIILYGSMGHILCGLSIEHLQRVVSVVDLMETLLPYIGSTLVNCPNDEALRILADSATNVYGPVTGWSPATVTGLGLIVAGLEPDQLVKLSNASLEAITPSATVHLQIEHVTKLALHQLESLSSEALSRLQVYHLYSHAEARISDDVYTKLRHIDHGVMANNSILSHTLGHFESIVSPAEHVAANPVSLGLGQPSSVLPGSYAPGRTGPATLVVFTTLAVIVCLSFSHSYAPT